MRNFEAHNRISMKRELTGYRAVIFDLDGTLYSQPKLRFLMACSLFWHFLLHPFSIKELFILKKYREVRECWSSISDTSSCSSGTSDSLETEQYAYTARQLGITSSRVQYVVSHWMQDYPRSLLFRCRDRKLAGLIASLKEKGICTAIYSDYPVHGKLAALGIETDYAFCSMEPQINCMKPNPKGMQAVLNAIGVSVEDALMIGDRYSRDGMSAKNMGMDFIILKKSIPLRSFLYRRLIP